MTDDRSQMMLEMLLGIQSDVAFIKQELASQFVRLDRMIAFASQFGLKSNA